MRVAACMSNKGVGGLRKLGEADRGALLRYVGGEAAYNIFIMGDVESHGLCGPLVAVYAREADDGWDSVVLRYGTSFVVYAKDEGYDAAAVAALIGAHPFDTISGKGSVVQQLTPYFPQAAPRMTILARCDAMAKAAWGTSGFTIRRVTPDEAGAVVGLFCRIGEFQRHYLGREAAQTAQVRSNLLCGGIGVGAFEGERLVSYAQTTARNAESAMVVGVCTLPAWRGQGLASAVLRALCCESFGEGIGFVCLFYDNAAAGRIYSRLGFYRVGAYMMIESPQRVGAPA
jgi:predicted GNAT family acetyltransferase